MVAALERFMRETAPTPVAPAPRIDRWARTALLEGVARDAGPDAWGDAHPWGR